jgi:Pectate lyase superfamily protein
MKLFCLLLTFLLATHCHGQGSGGPFTATGTFSGNGAGLTNLSATNFSSTFVNVKAAPFNARGDNIADDTVAIQAAVAYVNTLRFGATLYFPGGEYKTSGNFVITNNGIIWRGDGRYATRITYNNGIGSLIAFSNVATGAIRGMYLLNNANPVTIGAVVLCTNQTQDMTIDFDDVFISGGYDGIEQWNANNFLIHNCFFQNMTNAGLVVANIINPNHGDSYVTSSQFYGNKSQNYGALLHSGGGVSFIGDKFVGNMTNGISVQASGGNSSLLQVIGCSLENLLGPGITSSSLDGSTWLKFIIQGEFDMNVTPSSNAIYLTQGVGSEAIIGPVISTGTAPFLYTDGTVGVTLTGVMTNSSLSLLYSSININGGLFVPVSPLSNFFVLPVTNTLVTGTSNWGVGPVFPSLTTGAYNSAAGFGALGQLFGGVGNTAFGYDAVGFSGANAVYDTGTGFRSQLQATGSDNTSTGAYSLEDALGNLNVADGYFALKVTLSAENTAGGALAGQNLSLGSNNVFNGFLAGASEVGGSYNICDGWESGWNGTANTFGWYSNILMMIGPTALSGGESNVIEIGNVGVSGDQGVIRIGTSGVQSNFFIAGNLHLDSAYPSLIGAPNTIAGVSNLTATNANISGGLTVTGTNNIFSVIGAGPGVLTNSSATGTPVLSWVSVGGFLPMAVAANITSATSPHYLGLYSGCVGNSTETNATQIFSNSYTFHNMTITTNVGLQAGSNFVITVRTNGNFTGAMANTIIVASIGMSGITNWTPAAPLTLTGPFAIDASIADTGGTSVLMNFNVLLQ